MDARGEMQIPMWVEAARLDDLEPGGRTTFRHGRHQVLLLRDDDGEVTAIDNRCPHEGYPLSQGDVKDGQLTCAWHNWKFRLGDGKCILGGEDVRRYDVWIRDGAVFIDFDEPPASQQLPKLDRSLEEAFREADWARAARDAERMLRLGRTFGDVLGFACDWAAEHGKYGMSHGLAAAADYAALAAQFPESSSALLLEAMHDLVMPHLRRARQRFAEPEVVAIEHTPSGYAPLGLRLRARIEREELARAQALLRGAIDDEVPAEAIFDWLTSAATDHFYDYAHGHIYVVKVEELLRQIGWSHAHPVLTALVSTIVHGTREDTLPYMRAWRNAMDERAERIGRLAAADATDAGVGLVPFLDAVLGDDLLPALDAVLAALEAGVRADRVALALGIAASERLLRFDPAIDADASVSEGWLHATHLLTHADAARESVLRYPGTDALRGLFHSARFIQHAHVLDMAGSADTSERVDGDPKSAFVGALAARDPVRGVAAARVLVLEDPSVLESALLESCLSTPWVQPIFVQHHVKTVLAAVRIARAARDEPSVGEWEASLPLLATARFLCHPQRERRMRATSDVARAFVSDGTMRGNLLGY